MVKEFWREAASQEACFYEEKLMWHRPVESNAVGYSSQADAVVDYFAAFTAALTYNASKWAGQAAEIAHCSLWVKTSNIVCNFEKFRTILKILP